MVSNLSTIPGYAIVEILQEEKERKFYKDVVMRNGTVVKLTLDIPIGGNYDAHFSQGVSIARIVAVGDGADFLQPGDEVVVDYTLDTEKSKIIGYENGSKRVRAVAVNKFYNKDSAIMSASSESKYETYEYRKGDVEEVSTIFGIIHGNEIIPNYPYVFTKYVAIEGEFEETESGLVVPSSEGEVVIRQILFAHPDSPMKPGETVIVDYASLYEREVNGELLSICMDVGIFGRFTE